MIGYITLGVTNFDKAAAFYDDLLGSIGASRTIEMERVIGWATSPGSPQLCIIKPFDGQPATAGNGTMVSFAKENPDQVKAFYDKAISLGATDEGAPGFRPPEAEKGFYGAYFRDPEGHKIAAFCMIQ